MTIVEQLNDIYYKYEYWHKNRLSLEEITNYHEKMLSKNRIIVATDGDTLCGYVEHWRINFEQFGRIVCGEPISGLREDIEHGQLAYVANTFIYPEWRGSWVTKYLRDQFFMNNITCTHFCGNAIRKKAGLIKVFKKDMIKSYLKESV